MNLKGKILLSPPNIKDTRFYKSVVYICLHNKDGALGVIINKSLEERYYPSLLGELGINKLKLNNKILFNYGGPVESNRGFILHSDDHLTKDSIPINKGVALTSSFDILEDITKGNGPNISMIALGYAGWGPGQLEKEISDNGWVSSVASTNFIFDENNNLKWNKAYRNLGIDPYYMTSNFGRA